MPTVLAATTPSTSVPPAPTVDPESLVYRLDVFFLIVLLIFAVFNAPRAIARFARRSEWYQGHFLYSAPILRKPRINLNTNSIYLHSDPQKTVLDLDGESTENMHSQSVPYLPYQLTLGEKVPPPYPWTSVVPPVPSRQTWHMPMLSSLVPPIASVLHHRVHDNYSLGQVLLMAGYTIIIFYAGLYQSNPFVDYTRSGWVGISQLPFIYILATKNNVIGMLIGVGYEKVRPFRRCDFGARCLTLSNSAELPSSLPWTFCHRCCQRSCYRLLCVSSSV